MGSVPIGEATNHRLKNIGAYHYVLPTEPIQRYATAPMKILVFGATTITAIFVGMSAFLRGAVVLFGAATVDNTNVSWPTVLAAYGVAMPFAGICLLQMNRSQKREESWEDKYAADMKTLQDRIQTMHDAALQRERENVARLGPLVYDAAMLYKQGNETMSKTLVDNPVVEVAEKVPSQLDELMAKIDALTARINQTDPPNER